MRRKKNDLQINMMDDVDRYEQDQHDRELAFIQTKLETYYMKPADRYGAHHKSITDGQVVIMCMQARTQRDDHYWVRYFRCVAEHHMAVGGMMLHLISAPNDEWPDEPVWQAWHGCRWIYPEGGLWIRKEPEFEKEIGWGSCGECYKNCEECQKLTGPYPRCRKENQADYDHKTIEKGVTSQPEKPTDNA